MQLLRHSMQQAGCRLDTSAWVPQQLPVGSLGVHVVDGFVIHIVCAFASPRSTARLSSGQRTALNDIEEVHKEERDGKTFFVYEHTSQVCVLVCRTYACRALEDMGSTQEGVTCAAQPCACRVRCSTHTTRLLVLVSCNMLSLCVIAGLSHCCQPPA